MRSLVRVALAGASILGVVVGSLVVATPAQATPTSKFVTMLSQLATDNAYHSGYVRTKFKHWIDADGDGCNTRAEVLKAESKKATGHRNTCTITSGKWLSLYDNVTVTQASQLDIDHLVPLAEAWRSGAYNWSSARRQNYANDLGYAYSLIAVTATTNREKSDSDPADWVPWVRSFRCTYAAEWVAVKWRWGLTVDGAERAALRVLLGKCSTVSVTLPRRA